MSWGGIVQRFFGTKGSKDEAKGRLQIVLAYDRLGLSADQMEALRKDIMETISRHVAIDTDRVSGTRSDGPRTRVRPVPGDHLMACGD